MYQQPRWNDSLVVSYLFLRKAVGVNGIGLPIVLSIGKWLLESPGFQSSISAYYYTIMRDVFVGSLCATAIFMLSYRGYERKDGIASNVASVSALGVAILPTSPGPNATVAAQLIGRFHLCSAVCFFLTMAYFSLFLFRKTDRQYPTKQKLHRNRVYTVCGYTILACIGLIALLSFVSNDSPIKRISPVFWLETVAVVAFGVSWLTKGEAFLKDKDL